MLRNSRLCSIEYINSLLDHGLLLGLGDDDHTQYLLADGTRDLTGDWTIGSNNITLTGGTLTANTLTDGTGSLTGGDLTGLTSLVVDSLTINDVGGHPHIRSTTGEMRLYPDGIAQSRYLKLAAAGNLLTLEAGGTPGATNLKIIASSGDIDFDDENLTTTGILTTGKSIIDNISIDGSSILVDSGASGILTLGGTGGTFNENLTLDFEAVNNKVEINSGTGVTGVRWRIHQFFLDNKYFSFGSGDDARFLWNAVGTNHQFVLGLMTNEAAKSGYFSIMNRLHTGDVDRQPAGVVENPTLRIWSNDATSATDYIDFYHDQDDGVIATGTGDLNLIGATGTTLGDGGITDYSRFATDGDLTFVGTAGLPFGSFWGNEIAFVTAGGTGTFSVVSDADITVGQTHNTAFQNNQEIDIGTFAGMYAVWWSMSVKGTGANKHIVGAIGIDVGGVTGDVAQNDGRNHGVTMGNAEMPLAGCAILDLSADDEVSVMVTNETDNTNVTIEHVNLVIGQWGGT